MDIVLKGEIDGITAAERIWENFGIPVIYLTAYADEPTLQRAKVTEPFGYILKPFDERELQTTIEMAFYKAKMDKTLREREEWLSTILRSIGDGVIATDVEGRDRLHESPGRAAHRLDAGATPSGSPWPRGLSGRDRTQAGDEPPRGRPGEPLDDKTGQIAARSRRRISPISRRGRREPRAKCSFSATSPSGRRPRPSSRRAGTASRKPCPGRSRPWP